MSIEKDVITVAVKAAKEVMIHANGNPANIVAVGVAAGATFVCVGAGYGIYRGGDKLFNWMRG